MYPTVSKVSAKPINLSVVPQGLKKSYDPAVFEEWNS